MAQALCPSPLDAATSEEWPRPFVQTMKELDKLDSVLNYPVKIFGYDDIYPVYAYFGIFFNMVDLVLEHSDKMKEIVVAHPYLLPLRIVPQTIEQPHVMICVCLEKVVDVLLNNDCYQYLLAYMNQFKYVGSETENKEHIKSFFSMVSKIISKLEFRKYYNET